MRLMDRLVEQLPAVMIGVIIGAASVFIPLEIMRQPSAPPAVTRYEIAPKEAPAETYNAGLYEDAALDKLWGRIPFLHSWNTHAEGRDALAKIAAERVRVSRLKDERWRKAFTHWLDYAEKSAREAGQEADKDRAVKDLLAENPPA